MLAIIMKIIEAFMQASKSTTVTVPKQKEPEAKPCAIEAAHVEKVATIDWSNPEAKISKYFTVKESTYLPSWSALHIPSEEEKARILEVAEKMDLIHEFLGQSIHVHVWLRPAKANCPGNPHDGQDYNEWLYKNVVWKGLSEEEKAKKKIPNSPHKDGNAVDWSLEATNESCDVVRNKLMPKLAEWNVRMEDVSDLAKRNWVHIDTRAVVNRRYFKP